MGDRSLADRRLLSCALLFLLAINPFESLADCGDATVDFGEQCDDGGFCIGGPLAGAPCFSEAECLSGGACFGGLDDLAGCETDGDCRGGPCLRCRPVGGDGCAANCTEETGIVIRLVEGRADGGIAIRPGTSGVVINGPFIPVIPLPFYRADEITILAGRSREGQIPVAIKSEAVRLARIPIGTGACGCVRVPPMATCGGTLSDALGEISQNCTPGFPGAASCPGDQPCAPVNGPGNGASGFVHCGAQGVDLSITQDCNGVPEMEPFSGILTRLPAPRTFGGNDANAFLTAGLAIGTVVGSCSGTDPAYGIDGQFCTDDDAFANRGPVFALPLTTNAATGTVLNPADFAGDVLGPFGIEGTSFVCGEDGSVDVSTRTLAGVATACDQPTISDIVMTVGFVADGAPLLPGATPTPALCTGDCSGDGQVTVDEVLKMVVIALSLDALEACTAGDANSDRRITVDEIMRATMFALDGCG